MINFEFIDRQELYDALEVNNVEHIEVKRHHYGDFSYLCVENFLKTPEKAIELLSRYPALDGGVYTPGARQNLTPMDLVPILKAYREIVASTGRNVYAQRFVTSSNILWKGVKAWKNSWMPHADFDLVCNLWLCNYEGGTAIYKYKGVINAKDIVPPSSLDASKLVPWQNFEGDEDWELYYIIPSKYNTVVVYDGTNFHSTYANFNEEYRYSLISFYQPEGLEV